MIRIKEYSGNEIGFELTRVIEQVRNVNENLLHPEEMDSEVMRTILTDVMEKLFSIDELLSQENQKMVRQDWLSRAK
jgi:hypothetical protein